jgi:NADH dehydrogenase/NADH:ubiquinone oxidoreductase subunit G
MGLCYECLVTVNHIPDQRACMTLVQEGMEIRTHD